MRSDKIEIFEKKFFFQNFIIRLILQTKFLVNDKIRIYIKNDFDQNIISDFRSNSFFKNDDL